MASHRQIIMFDRVSADGYFASPDGGLDWAVPEPEIEKGAASSLGSTDTILFGRKTYEMFERVWPHALDDERTAADPHNAGRRTPEIRAMAVWINDATKIVFSRTLKESSWKNTRIIPEFRPDEVAALKRASGKDMMIFGSGTIAALLAEHGLIDEYRFIVCPVLLGRGKSLLGTMGSRVRVVLASAKPYPSGNVALTYRDAQ